jgi:hypothetical protein
MKHPAPRQMKLCVCSNVSNKIGFKCPSGHHYRLVLGLPTERKSLYFFNGIVTIYEKGVEIHQILFNPSEIKGGNWLDKESLDTYILNSIPGSFSTLDRYIKEGKDYEIIIDFEELPPEGTSLWLCYLSAVWDR